MTNPFSIYIHIPFCEQKCNYCAFYSFASSENTKREYAEQLINEIKKRGGQTVRPVYSVYFGGGTPSVLGAEKLCKILGSIFESFNVLPNAEITLEANPADDLKELFSECRKAGFNRLSLGVQSANENDLKKLGRRNSFADAARTVKDARDSGFNNISLDLMLGLPDSTNESLKFSLDKISALKPEHISCYILKLEEGTPLYTANMLLPDDDAVAEQYLFMCDYLRQKGYEHYEISNFSKPDFESRHNSAYWRCFEYLGFGPSAHSFFEGKRFYYPNSLEEYLTSPTPVFDGNGGDSEEYIMLGLRLKSGISSTEHFKRFGKKLSPEIFKKAEKLKISELCEVYGDNISLTEQGMLVSNSIISLLTEEI